MKVSEVITRLQELQKKHGDLPVRSNRHCGEHEIADAMFIRAYDAGGQNPDYSKRPAIVIFIH